MRFKKYLQRVNIELLVWPTALILLYFMDPLGPIGQSFCLLKRIGIPWCPGCGLGHGIHYLLHGEWKSAFKSHPLAPFALGMLIYRTIQLGRIQWQSLSELKNHYT